MTKLELPKRTLIIIRGLPGAGKSTEAEKYGSKHSIATTDDYPGLYSVSEDGTLEFNGSKKIGEFPMIAHAHEANKKKVSSLMCASIPYIVVPNTNTRYWECHQYIEIAKRWNYGWKYIDLFDAGLSDEELADRCIHNVPVKIIAKMRLRYEFDVHNDHLHDELWGKDKERLHTTMNRIYDCDNPND